MVFGIVEEGVLFFWDLVRLLECLFDRLLLLHLSSCKEPLNFKSEPWRPRAQISGVRRQSQPPSLPRRLFSHRRKNAAGNWQQCP